MNAIEFDHVGKQYRLGLVSTGTFSHDLNRWWTMNVRHKEDPNLKIGETNDRSHKGESNYVWALKDINFSVEQGDVVGIIGKNGAGKSTLLKLLSRVTTPTVGEIRARGRIASLLEVGTGFHPEMTGRENIYMNGAIMGMTKAEISRKLDEIVDFSGCERYIDTPVKRYSSGMTVRLGFAIAAHLEPEILVVDEVLAVGDAEFQKKAIGKMQDVSKGEGRTVLFVSHNMASVRKLCKSGLVLKNGFVDFCGSVEECVDYYINHNVDKRESYIQIATENTINPAKEVCFLSVGVEEKENGQTTQEPLSFIIEIQANNDVINCRLNTTIYGADDIPIGSVSSRSFFPISAGEKKKIRSVGLYTARFSVGIGNFTEGQRDFDYTAKALSFSVDRVSDLDEEGVVQWNNAWGHIMLPYKQEIIELYNNDLQNCKDV